MPKPFDIESLRPENISRATEIQHLVGLRVRLRHLKKSPRHIAGVDAAFTDGEVFAAAALYSYPQMRHLEDSLHREKVRFPYIPGFLSFREGPALVRAIEKLENFPDAILVDGHGIAHPRGAGLASHIGVILNIPTIGCAKSRLTGVFEEPENSRGEWSYLYLEGDRSRQIGAVVRTGVRPVFVSPGHMIDIDTAVKIVLGCLSGYRIPEPLRRADQAARRQKEGSQSPRLP